MPLSIQRIGDDVKIILEDDMRGGVVLEDLSGQTLDIRKSPDGSWRLLVFPQSGIRPATFVIDGNEVRRVE